MVVQAVKPIPIDRVRFWANQLAGESRDSDWFDYGYLVPNVLSDIAKELAYENRGLIGLVGAQGIGKSSAMKALFLGKPYSMDSSRILFKWRTQKELFTALLNSTHEATDEFLSHYLPSLMMELKGSPASMWNRVSSMPVEDQERYFDFAKRVEKNIKNGFTESQRETSDIPWIEAKIGKTTTQRLREQAWLRTLQRNHVILIDTPDYSKTDKRRMDRDLEDIYWFWNNSYSAGRRPTIIVAIQKEMFGGHYFLDKMRKFELSPLTPEQMVEAYRLGFETTYPFSEDGLLTVARMSRGIFRRFLRYILLAIDFWEKPNQQELIDAEIVKKAVPIERLAEDMDLEFLGMFPKHSELRKKAVELVIYLQENGPQKQTQLVQSLDLEPYALSRLLSKLESIGHLKRSREGVDKIVSLRSSAA